MIKMLFRGEKKTYKFKTIPFTLLLYQFFSVRRRYLHRNKHIYIHMRVKYYQC